VPAYFTEKRRRATQQAGEIAGLDVIGTLNEPMAATLAYGLNQQGDDLNVVVYDLGGGTFDVTVVRITPDEIVELATAGNRRLGGRDWDKCLIDLVAEDFERKHGVDPRGDAQARLDLQVECERAKRRLTRSRNAAIRLHAFQRDHVVDVSRERFEQVSLPLLQTTRLTLDMAD
jgi:molecular chaperone DnaK